MTQDEVIRILKKTKKWMTAREMAKALKVSSGSTSHCARKIFETTNEIERKILQLKEGGGLCYSWRIKRRR